MDTDYFILVKLDIKPGLVSFLIWVRIMRGNIYTKHVKTEKKEMRLFFCSIGTQGPWTDHSALQKWENLDDPIQLRSLFAEIKKETEYENTLGYDIYCSASYISSILLDLSMI